MAGGIDFSIGTAAFLAETAALTVTAVATGSTSAADVLNSIGITVPTLCPYRDKQQNKPAVYSMSVPNSSTSSAIIGQPISSNTQVNVVGPTVYVFDAVLVANHRKRIEATSKPLQSGYNISDHAIKIQPEVTLEIGMSDAMAAFAPGQWIGNPSKSLSAWQVLNKIADNRVLVTLATRQETYRNMMIVGIDSPETNKTVKGLKVNITFKQMLIVTVTSTTLSARPNATDQTQQATLQTSDPSTTLVQQHGVDPSTLPSSNSNSVTNSFGVPAGGQFSSNNLPGK